MKTLIVNSYHADPEKKIEPYVNWSVSIANICRKRCHVHKDYDLSGFDAVILSGSPG